MLKLLHGFYNMDTNSVELIYSDGSVLTIDCEEAENSYNVTNSQMADLDWLIYHALMEYAGLVVSGKMASYLSVNAIHAEIDRYTSEKECEFAQEFDRKYFSEAEDRLLQPSCE